MIGSRQRAFTLVELIVVIAIVGTLISLLVPVTQRVLASADSAKCAENLRQLGVIIQTAANDNNGRFPRIENDPTDPIHTDEKMQTLAELVLSQDAGLDILKCPADVRNNGGATGRTGSYFKTKGSSYEWLPFFEDELVSNPTIRAPFGQFTVPLSHVRLVMDYAESGEAPHERSAGTSAMNVLYGDGSVRKVVLSDDDDAGGGPPP
jgi:prepilin-type N-terminal cleavage/methylation domain-containing protein/prepilin-type processing-associated H-X9-DG protein